MTLLIIEELTKSTAATPPTSSCAVPCRETLWGASCWRPVGDTRSTSGLAAGRIPRRTSWSSMSKPGGPTWPGGEETHGVNILGEAPRQVWEHYSGMIAEAFGIGGVIRYNARAGIPGKVTVLRRDYNHDRVGVSHTWLPINLELNSGNQRLFASFAGFRPRLFSRHIAKAYPGHVSASNAHYVPPLLMRLDAQTLEIERSTGAAVSYAESPAVAVATVARTTSARSRLKEACASTTPTTFRQRSVTVRRTSLAPGAKCTSAPTQRTWSSSRRECPRVECSRSAAGAPRASAAVARLRHPRDP